VWTHSEKRKHISLHECITAETKKYFEDFFTEEEDKFGLSC
jgi:hypothetical protein